MTGFFSTIARALALVLILGAAPAVAQRAPAEPAFGEPVSDITVIGNRRIEPATVASYLALERGDPITPEALNNSVRRLFETGLFRDAAVAADGTRLIVQVEENPTINRVAFEGNSALTDEDLLQNVSSRPRRAFTRSRAEADAQTIIEIYRRTGRYGASVEPVIIERSDNRVDLVFEIEEGPITGVEAINFVGNEVFSDRRLRGVIDTSESGLLSFIISSDIYDPDRLEFDKELLRSFYLSRGYADFSVLSAVAELAPDREGFFITFTVDEGPQYDFGEQAVVSAAPGIEPEEFEALIEGEPGDTYSADLVERNIDRMVFLAGQRGFAFVEVRPRADRNPDELTVDVTYELVEGPRVYVERIDIEGNTRTLDRVIRRQFDIVEGDAFNSRKIDRARRRIRGLNFFETVEVDVEPGATEDRAVVNVEVEEASTGSLTFGLGFSTSEGVIGEVNLSERNFLGRGQFVRARVIAAGELQVYDFTFREPAFLDRQLEAGFNVFFRQEDREDESSFDENEVGFIPTIAFPVSENGRLSLDYEISRSDITDVPDDASVFIEADKGEEITSAVGYVYTYDQRNDPLEPSQGYLVRVGQDVAGLGGDAQFIRTTGRVRGFTSFFDEDVVASLELEAGHIFSFSDELRITDRFFLGGDSFRGFENSGIGPRDLATDDALGGNIFTIARADVSFPVGLPEEFGIFGGVFADVGTLYELDRTQLAGVTIDDDPELRASVGVSVFWDSGFGPLRVNFGLPVLSEDGDEEEFFRLTAGTRF